MSIVDDSHLTDEVVNAAFEGTNFGRTDFRTILAETVMKRASGYHSGYTATTICIRLGLLGKHDRPTKLGLTFAFHHYYKPSVREVLMLGRQKGPKVILPSGYSIRSGHPINEGERSVMIPKADGPWFSRFDVEHALLTAGVSMQPEGN